VLDDHTPPGNTICERLANQPELEKIFDASSVDYDRWPREIGFSKVSAQSGLSWEHGLIIAEQ
jgi:hypothetical protein